MNFKGKIYLALGMGLVALGLTTTNVNAARTDMIDVSSHNNAGKVLSVDQLTSIRNNYGVKSIVVKLSEGSTYSWSGAQQTISNAKAAGLYTNGYHYARYGTLGKAQAEANKAVSSAQNAGLGVGSVLVADVESSEQDTAGLTTTNAMNAIFQATVEKAGYRYDVYTNAGRIGSTLSINTGGWVASYPKTVTTDKYTNYNAWQWSSKMPFNGLSGVYDVSQLYNNYYTAGTDKNAVISDSATTNVTKVTSNTVKTGLSVDGKWGSATTLRLQKIYNMKWQDGRISKPSALIKVIQKHLGVTQDGYLGPITIRAMQRKLGTPVDGKISSGYSNMVASMQKKLNAGVKPF